jgi:ectoine hydroxylase
LAFESTFKETTVSRINHEQITSYDERGYLLLEGVFSQEEVAQLKCGVPPIVVDRTERTVLEHSNGSVRSVYGVHAHSRLFSQLARHPRLVEPVKQVLKGDVYVYQSKVNAKAAFDGDMWDWHQDYVYWLREDAMPAPRVLTSAVFLDDVTDLNGPLMLIPGSHRAGVLDFEMLEGRPQGYEDGPGWISNLTAKLKYTLDRRSVARLARERGVVAPKGRAGSVLLFDGNVAHASPPNISPFERTLALFTYNRVDNAPAETALHRPDFLASRDCRPLTCVSDDALLGPKITRA